MRQLIGALFERHHQLAVLDIVAERVEADFLGAESHLRSPDQPVGIIDQPHHPQRRGFAGAAPPDIDPVEQVDRIAEQGGGAVVAIGQAPRDQRGRGPGGGNGNGGGDAGRTAADHHRIEMVGLGENVAHASHLTAPPSFSSADAAALGSGQDRQVPVIPDKHDSS